MEKKKFGWKLRHTINKTGTMIKSKNEKRQSFLHIGLGRTGSDFIQKFFQKFSILSI